MISFSAPGSVMLMGEHAILFGHKAIVCAVDKRMTVHLKPRKDQVITIDSVLGQFQGQLHGLVPAKPFEFVLQAIIYYREACKTGFDLVIASDFSHEVGLGSSAAVVVALVGALQAFTGQSFSKESIFDVAFELVKCVQGVGSGADIVASTYGGINAYYMGEKPDTISANIPLTLLYAGYKTKTVDVIERVQSEWRSKPEALIDLYNRMNEATEQVHLSLLNSDSEGIQSAIHDARRLMATLGVEDGRLRQLIQLLEQHPNILAAKISGSGLGDCVIGVGAVSIDFPAQLQQKGVCQIPIKMTQEGVMNANI